MLRNGILHATQLVKGMEFDGPTRSSSVVHNDNAASGDVLSESKTSSGDEEDDVKLIISSGRNSTPTAVLKDCSDKVDNQLSLNDDYEQPQPEFLTESAPTETGLNYQLVVALIRSSPGSCRTDRVKVEKRWRQLLSTNHQGVLPEQVPDSIPCPYYLPRSVFREGVAAAAVTDPQTLNSLA